MIPVTSHPHIHFERGADDPVALFAIKDHDGARFEVDETCIPIKRNCLFLFNDGHSAHHTVLRSKKLGEDGVKFIVPFAAKTLGSVGGPCIADPYVAAKSGKGAKGRRRVHDSEKVEDVGIVEDLYLSGEAEDKISDQQGFHIEDEEVDIGVDRDLEEEAEGEIVIEDPEKEELMR